METLYVVSIILGLIVGFCMAAIRPDELMRPLVVIVALIPLALSWLDDGGIGGALLQFFFPFWAASVTLAAVVRRILTSRPD